MLDGVPLVLVSNMMLVIFARLRMHDNGSWASLQTKLMNFLLDLSMALKYIFSGEDRGNNSADK